MSELIREVSEPAAFVWLFCLSVAVVCLWVAFAVFSARTRRRLISLETDELRVRQWLAEREVELVCKTRFWRDLRDKLLAINANQAATRKQSETEDQASGLRFAAVEAAKRLAESRELEQAAELCGE